MDPLQSSRLKCGFSQKQRRKSQKDDGESESMKLIHEIFNPTLKIIDSKGPYKPPDPIQQINMEDIDVNDLDEKKLVELKEVFALFDTDCDGLISQQDLETTLTVVGTDFDDGYIAEMLSEVKFVDCKML